MNIKWTCILPARLLFVYALTLSAPSMAQDETVTETAQAGRVLGSISFPTSTRSPEAQQAFIDGMLLLHLFEYPYARDEFLKAQELDRDFAMAYWGEAMTHNHPIWDKQDLQAARMAMLKLGSTPEERITRTPVAREQGFLAALEVLYGPGTKAQRDLAYMRSMEQLAARFPDDHEIQLFYALSLFGVQAGVRDTRVYMLCTALAQGVFSQNPQHPGAAHYLIHGVDDPVHAMLGLQAARALAVMAPDAGHSQHMTSHIFVALGMWDDVVLANETAVSVQTAMRAEKGMPERHWGHYNQWLLYGLLQQGRYEQARSLLEAAYSEARTDGKSPADRLNLHPDNSLVGSVVQMWARYIIETRQWNSDVANWSFNSGDAFDPNLTISFIRAMQSADKGLAAETEQYITQFRKLRLELEEIIGRQEEQSPTDLVYLQRLAVMELELQAAREYAKGERAGAIRFAEQASQLEEQMPFSFGPPFVDLPSAEFLGDLLLESRKYQEAAVAYELQLERAQQKSLAILGLARSLRAMEKATEAEYQASKLERIWAGADEAVILDFQD